MSEGLLFFLSSDLEGDFRNDILVPSLKSINTASPLIYMVYDAYDGKDKHDPTV